MNALAVPPEDDMSPTATAAPPGGGAG
jgi:hypothetical protein